MDLNMNSIETREALREASMQIRMNERIDLARRMQISLDLSMMRLELLNGMRTAKQMQESLEAAAAIIRHDAQAGGTEGKRLLQLADDIERAGMAHDFMHTVLGADQDAEPVTQEDFKNPDMVDDAKDMPVWWYITKRDRLVCDIVSEPDLIALLDQGITVWHSRPSEEQIEEARRK